MDIPPGTEIDQGWMKAGVGFYLDDDKRMYHLLLYQLPVFTQKQLKHALLFVVCSLRSYFITGVSIWPSRATLTKANKLETNLSVGWILY